MPRTFEEEIGDSLRALLPRRGEPAPPRRMTISVPGDLYEDIDIIAKRLQQSWSNIANLLMRHALPHAQRVIEQEQMKVEGPGLLISGPVEPDAADPEAYHSVALALNVTIEQAKELLLNPALADDDPESYKTARWLQSIGFLEPEFPPEDPSRVEEIRQAFIDHGRESLSRHEAEKVAKE